jgi:hypothetical protein
MSAGKGTAVPTPIRSVGLKSRVFDLTATLALGVRLADRALARSGRIGSVQRPANQPKHYQQNRHDSLNPHSEPP